MVRMLYWLTAILLLWTATGTVRGGNVTYDGRSLIINGQHKILFSGSIHYPRSTPDVRISLFCSCTYDYDAYVSFPFLFSLFNLAIVVQQAWPLSISLWPFIPLSPTFTVSRGRCT